MPDRQTALLVAHGQPSAPAPAEAALARLAGQVAALLPKWLVRSAARAMEGSLERQIRDGMIVLPFFMSRGWFADQVLPRRLGDAAHVMAPPFGLDPALPELAARALRDGFAARGWQPAESSVLLAAHGSARGPRAAEAAEDFAAALRGALPGTEVRTGYVEQAPFLADAAAPCGARSLCLPFFALSGFHVRDDLSAALQEAAYPGAVLPALGALDGVPQLLARALLQAAAGKL
jgi:sirohydrochlorin ferrochelatase